MTTAEEWTRLEADPRVTIAANGSFVPDSRKEDEQ